MEIFLGPDWRKLGWSMAEMWRLWQELTATDPGYGHENPKGLNGNWTL